MALKNVALYARISKKDKREHHTFHSIENQILLLKEIVQSEKIQGKIVIFTDDGYSGTGCNRPAFQKMIAQIAQGKIAVLLVKDFSRFSREHLLMSQFRENIFKEYHIRFISVADRYDSKNTAEDELLPSFKSIFNEYYCKDISHKVKGALEARKSAGKYAVSSVPLGYAKSKDKEHIEICEEEAVLVQKIYELANMGYNNMQIASYMNEHHLMAGRKATLWEAAYIWSILNNPVYTGCQVWHKYENKPYQLCKSTKLSYREWYFNTDNHQPVIDKNLYQEVQKKRTHIYCKKKGKRHIFHGITKCMNCKKALCMDRAKKGFLCCNHCGKEQKKIAAEELFYICRQVFKERIKSENIVLNSNYEKELWLNMFFEKIEIGQKEIVIHWKFCEK